MKELIKYIVQALVDNPEQVEISEIKGGNTTIFELKVAKKDLGKVIGKSGRNANAIRTILTAASATAQKGRAILEIIE
ncbi:MAG: KH domain-containing protein [Deltaproteobacteria bacterium]|nr:KH domain-containing protein [Deltaproteobacteria bacterium]